MSEAKLQVEDVRHEFGATPALAPTSLEVREREFVSIVGPSGCGKSTLFNIVSGLIRPTEGRVLLDGRDVTGTTGHVGYMLQKDLLLPWRTVTENIVLAASLHGRVTRQDRTEAVALADRYGLGEFVDHYPHALSGGMRQRVALMRTLAFHRDVMLLDVWADQGRTIAFITHDVDEAIFLSDRVLVMSARPGRIRASFDIPLARPREFGLLTSDAFTQLKREILELLYSETLKQLEREPEETAA